MAIEDGPTPVEGRLIDARFELTKALWGDVPKLFSHSVLAQLGLPYRSLGLDVRTFQRISGKTSLQMEAGFIPGRHGTFVPVQLPAGPKARLVLLHLCSEAVKNQSPVVEVDESFTAFAKSLGLSINGQNLKTLREQVLRMSVVSMRLAKNYGEFVDVYQGSVFDRLRVNIPDDPDQQALWTNTVEFSHAFYESLRHNAVPLRLEAIGALKHSARALDVYAWMSHRLFRVNKPVYLRWGVLQAQFGTKTQDRKGFKRAFRTAMKQVLMVYPRAKVHVAHGGIVMKNSPPPVPFRKPKMLDD